MLVLMNGVYYKLFKENPRIQWPFMGTWISKALCGNSPESLKPMTFAGKATHAARARGEPLRQFCSTYRVPRYEILVIGIIALFLFLNIMPL